jgi:hypothetical protein
LRGFIFLLTKEPHVVEAALVSFGEVLTGFMSGRKDDRGLFAPILRDRSVSSNGLSADLRDRKLVYISGPASCWVAWEAEGD